MAVEVKMPQLGESVHEGMIGKWLKSPGDEVEKYEPLLEVVTDKVDTEVTAVDSGTLLEILVPEGETVSVGTVLARIGAAGEATDDGQADGGEDRAAEADGGGAGGASGAAAEADGAAGGAGEDDGVDGRPRGGGRASPLAAKVASEHGVDPAEIEGTGRGGQVTKGDVEAYVAARRDGDDGRAAARGGGGRPAGRDVGFVSPRVARLAAQHGVNLAEVEGTGRDGRITARDVEAFADARERAPRPAAPAAAPASAPPAAAGPSPGELVRLSPMRRAIADHMVRSKHTSPHVTTVHEVDMSAVTRAYRALKADYAAREVKLSYTAFIVHALARALGEHPLVNSSWTDDGVQVQREINIGMAVAVPQGLIVPVIRHADEKSLRGLARAIHDLATRAREKQLSPDDVQGGTFTLTNYGTLGSLFGTPVINQPQAAILGTGAIEKRVVVVEGPEGDQIAIRPMMYLALTFDHRILDGAAADPFMQSLAHHLEHYEA